MQSNTFSGLFEGQNVITIQRTPSTNEYLKKELSKSTPLAEGTVIMAVDQFAGRGQKGAIWQSEPGQNLTISLLLNPTFLHPKQQFHLTAAISIAIARWLESLLSTKVNIKWPNDIYIGNRKIGGILIENILKGHVWKAAIVGIGINVNQLVFPDSIRESVISIKQILHRDCNLLQVLTDLCKHIEQEYLILKQGNIETQTATYKKRLYLLGEPHYFLLDGVKVKGVIVGVTDAGRLKIDFNGHVADFDIKEVSFVV